MKPTSISPRVFARYYVDHEYRINEDAQILMVMPDGRPVPASYIDVDRAGRIILQAKPDEAYTEENELLNRRVQELERLLKLSRIINRKLRKDLERNAQVNHAGCKKDWYGYAAGE